MLNHMTTSMTRCLFDLGDENELKSVFETYDIEAVMHFAAFSSVAESVQEPEKYFKNNYATSNKYNKKWG